MKKQLVIIGIVALLVTVGLSGCNEINNNTEKNRFIGTRRAFEPTELIYEFFSNGTIIGTFIDSHENQFFGNLSNHSSHGTWELKNGKLVLTISEVISSTLDYHFSNNDTILIITPSGTTDQNLTLIKQ
ncbi:MAG: hypothetical protein IMZ43_06830 [Thermoplasmata archaeon]|nr:hypothetical protein [Thermoplasmata archaeon]